jgi:hypothetical protein
MITLSMTAGNDNDAIWIIKITTDNYTYKFATDSITLDSNLFDGAVIFKDSFSDVEKTVNMTGGGSLGQVGNFSFGISRYAGNSLVDGFFNEFYPKTSGEYLSGRLVEVGIVWRGATTEAEITWLEQHIIYGYVYNPNVIFIDCIEIAEIEAVELPYYSVQKDLDNGVSYFEDAPKDNYGATIPIVYGSFNIREREKKEFALSPCLLVDKVLSKFIVSSHPFKTTSLSLVTTDEYSVLLYVSELDNYLTLYKTGAGDTTASNAIIHTVTMQNALSIIYGAILIPFEAVSSYSDIQDLGNVLDYDPDTYTEIDAGEIAAFRINEGDISTNFGALGVDNVEAVIGIGFRVSSNDANDRDYIVNYRNLTLDTPASGAGVTFSHTTGTTPAIKAWDFSTDTTGKKDTVLPWELSELLNLEFFISNEEATPGDLIRIHQGYILLARIVVNKITKRNIEVNRQRNYGLRNGGGR